jgi:hypothetical protein
MARIRTIKPEFWGDEKLGPLSPITRLVFLALVSLADDAGRLLDSEKALDGQIFPHTSDTCRGSLDELSSIGRIQRGTTASGQRVIQVTNWHHQKIDKPNLRSALPPLTSDSTTIRRHVDDISSKHTNDLRPTTNDQRPPSSAARLFEQEEFQAAYDGFRTAHRNPDAFAATVLAHTTGLQGRYDWPTIGRALMEMRGAGSSFSPATLRAFCRRLLQPDAPPARAGDRITRGRDALRQTLTNHGYTNGQSADHHEVPRHLPRALPNAGGDGTHSGSVDAGDG